MTARRFLAGFGLGVLVLPLAAVVTLLVGGSPTTALLVVVALTAGAVSLRPVSGDRIAGVACGVVTTVVAGIGLFVWALAQGPWG